MLYGQGCTARRCLLPDWWTQRSAWKPFPLPLVLYLYLLTSSAWLPHDVSSHINISLIYIDLGNLKGICTHIHTVTGKGLGQEILSIYLLSNIWVRSGSTYQYKFKLLLLSHIINCCMQGQKWFLSPLYPFSRLDSQGFPKANLKNERQEPPALPVIFIHLFYAWFPFLIVIQE